jgi:Fe-Mn family superoxide dismutase
MGQAGMGPTRRNMLGRAAALLAAGAAPRGWMPQAGAQAPPAGLHSLPPLPYAPEANEPHIDAETMTIHHDRHHAAYVANLNAALKDQGVLAALPLHNLLARLTETPEAIRMALRNNAGGHANHTMFWGIMGGKGGTPAGPLLAAVDRDLGGMDAMRAAFNRIGLAQFGSGWVFVTVGRDGTLALQARPNQDTPLMEGGRVLMGNDVWEHAYYLKYQNRRADYLQAWWNVVNWDAVAARYQAAQAGTLGV